MLRSWGAGVCSGAGDGRRATGGPSKVRAGRSDLSQRKQGRPAPDALACPLEDLPRFL